MNNMIVEPLKNKDEYIDMYAVRYLHNNEWLNGLWEKKEEAIKYLKCIGVLPKRGSTPTVYLHKVTVHKKIEYSATIPKKDHDEELYEDNISELTFKSFDDFKSIFYWMNIIWFKYEYNENNIYVYTNVNSIILWSYEVIDAVPYEVVGVSLKPNKDVPYKLDYTTFYFNTINNKIYIMNKIAMGWGWDPVFYEVQFYKP